MEKYPVHQHPNAQPSVAVSETSLQEVSSSAVTVAIIPAHNEERFIASVIFKTRPYVSHIIVVDDGSSDHTAQLAAQAGAEVISHLQNQGKAQALNTGFKHALSHDPQVIICLDGDAQHDPKDIPTLIAPILNNEADVVIGSRFMQENRIPKWRQVGQHSLTLATNSLSGTPVTDSQSGFRAFSAAAAQALKFKTQHLSVESEMQFLFKPHKLRVTEVPISVSYQDGNKRNPIIHGLQILDALVGLVARRRPLALISLPGFILTIVALLLGFNVAATLDQTGQLAVGSALITVKLFIVGTTLILGGITLHSISHFMERLREDLKPSPATELVTSQTGSNFF